MVCTAVVGRDGMRVGRRWWRRRKKGRGAGVGGGGGEKIDGIGYEVNLFSGN